MVERRAGGAKSATWYREVSNYKAPFQITSMERLWDVTIHRLRMGYMCHWEIKQRQARECDHCNISPEQHLLRYILVCPTLIKNATEGIQM